MGIDLSGIINMAAETIAEESKQNLLIQLQDAKNSIRNYINKLDAATTEAENLYNQTMLENMKVSFTGMAKSLFENKNSKVQSLQIESILKEGYSQLMKLREQVTGESLSYHILISVGRGKNQRVYSGSIPQDKLLNFTYLTSGTDSITDFYKLRIKADATSKDQLINELLEQKAGHLLDTKIYKDVMKKLNQMGVKNKGNRGEIFRLLEFYNLDPYDNTVLEELKKSVVGGKKKTFYEEPDLQYITEANEKKAESIKALIGKDPSLATLKTIRKGFTDIEMGIDQILLTYSDKAKAAILEHSQGATIDLEADLREEIERQLQEKLANIFK